MNRTPISVALINNSLEIGGTEKQLTALAVRLDRERFRPLVISLTDLGPLAETMVTAGIDVHELRLTDMEHWTPLSLAHAVMSLSRRIGGRDLVHSFLSQSNVLTAFAARAARVPVVVAGRRGLFHTQPTARRVIGALATRLADVVVANSESVRQDVTRREGVPATKVRVIANGIDLEEFDRVALKESEPFSDDERPVVAVIANLHPYKGHVHFIDAWAQVRRAFPCATAILIGDGRERDALASQVAMLGLGSSIRFLGRRSDVPAILKSVDLVVHPSLEEGLPNALMEAMAAGRPIVATSAGGNRELVEHGATGLLVPLADAPALAEAMLGILATRDRAVAMGRAGRRRIATMFSMEVMVNAHAALYEELVAATRR